MSPKDAEEMANNVDPDQTARKGADWSALTHLSKNSNLNSVFFHNVVVALYHAQFQYYNLDLCGGAMTVLYTP